MYIKLITYFASKISLKVAIYWNSITLQKKNNS